MEFIKKHLSIIIFCVVLGASILVLFLYNRKQDNSYYEQASDISLKHYDVNEYIPVNISYDQMARIYLNDYINKLLYDREEAYNLLDYGYRQSKFSSYEAFSSYVDGIMSVKTKQATVVKYALTDKGRYKDFDVYDANDNLFIFRETGVLQYRVYFDRYTVNMK